MEKVTIIRMNSFRSEPRLIKEFEFLKSFLDVKILTWNLDKITETNRDIIAFGLYLPFGSVWLKPSYLLWFTFCFYHLCKLRPKVIHACDLEANLIARFYHFFFWRVKIVYDLFDVTADKYNWTIDSSSRKFLIRYEKKFIKRADFLIIPDETRIKQLNFSLKEQKDLRYEVIFNSDIFPENSLSKKISFKSKQVIKIVYVGIINRNIRGIEHLICAARKFTKSIFVTIAGFGVDEKYFGDMILGSKLKNIEFLGRLEYSDAKKLNKSSDLMISLLNPDFNNYKYATSTKIFDAFATMKPVITTKNTASCQLIADTCWGVCIPYNEDSLIKTIAQISKGKITFNLDPTRVVGYSWQNCQQKLKDIYAGLLSETKK